MGGSIHRSLWPSSKAKPSMKCCPCHLHQNQCQSFKNPSVSTKCQSLLNVQRTEGNGLTRPAGEPGAGAAAAHASRSSRNLEHFKRVPNLKRLQEPPCLGPLDTELLCDTSLQLEVTVRQKLPPAAPKLPSLPTPRSEPAATSGCIRATPAQHEPRLQANFPP